MDMSNPLVGENFELAVDAIRSRGYEAGITGWSINADGTAEFANAELRGSLLVKNGSKEIEIRVEDGGTYSGYPVIRLNPDVNDTTDAVILADEDPFTGQKSLIITSPVPDTGDVATNGSQLILRSDTQALADGAQATLTSGLDIALEAVRDILVTAGGDIGRVVLTGWGTTHDIAIVCNGATKIAELTNEGSYIKRGGLATPTLLNGWISFGAPWQPPRFVELPDHYGALTGVIKDGSVAVPVTLMNLPAQMRPANQQGPFICASDNARTAQIRIETDGDVVLQQIEAGGTWVSLATCRWPISGL